MPDQGGIVKRAGQVVYEVFHHLGRPSLQQRADGRIALGHSVAIVAMILEDHRADGGLLLFRQRNKPRLDAVAGL